MCRRSAYLTFFVLVFCLNVGVMHADLRHHWRFDGDLDDGVGSLDLTSTGGGPVFTVGKHGGAVEFDGGDYIYAELAVFMPSQTTCVWVRTSSSGQSILGWSGGHPTHGLHDRELYVNGDGTVTVRVWTGVATTVTSKTLVDDDTWHHIATGYTEGGETWLYVDGVFQGSTPSSGIYNSYPTSYLTVGIESNVNSYFTGAVDDVRVYDEALTEGQVLGAMTGGAFPFAFGPVPKDGTLHKDTWVSLSWRPGDLAVSHNVYLGDNFDDVNDGTGDTLRGNQGLTYFVAGFPGFPYPDGLVPGTTYYWRIDEVNEADPNSPWKGPVWNFTIPPKKAYNPVPGNGAKFLDAAATTLSWTPGFGAKLHTLYFGDDYDTVANAAGGLPQGIANYNPGPLELEKTYFWRVDEFDVANTHTGDVWSFTTAKVGGGIRGDYYRGMNFENHVLTRTDTQINFNWGDPGGPDPAVGNDGFSARWTGEVEAAFTETYTFYTSTDDGARLWVDGQQLVNSWVDQGTTEYRGTIDLVAGNTYSLIMEYYENGGGAVAELRWSSPSTPKQIIPQAALAPPIKASSPSPYNRATGTKMTPILR